jgi:hypothetical protein
LITRARSSALGKVPCQVSRVRAAVAKILEGQSLRELHRLDVVAAAVPVTVPTVTRNGFLQA